MNRKIFIIIVAFLGLMPFRTVAQNKAQTPAATTPKPVTITFNGGSCQITGIELRPMWAPAGMKEDEKAFNLQFKYTLNSGIDSKIVSTLYDDGQIVAPNGKVYKAGAAMSNDEKNIYILTIAVPKTLDIGTLSFVFNKQKVPLKPFIKD